MSAVVDFRTVRYSLVEGTHYFYDDKYPSTIQFLLSGSWESWDVGWVKYKAQDPDIRRIANEAETRLIEDPDSGYQQWPSPPLPGPPPTLVNDHVQSQPATASPPSPSIADSVYLLPSPEYAQPAPSNPVPTQEYGPPSSTAHAKPYSSPYGHLTHSTSTSTQPPTTNWTPVHAKPIIEASLRVEVQPPQHLQHAPYAPYAHLMHSTSDSTHPPMALTPVYPEPTIEASSRVDVQPPQHPQHAYPPHGLSLQPAAPTGVVLTRRREIKILLSIDGDGVRGLSALLVIESLVNAISVKVGQRLDPHQIFDLTGGSSLGGVIAILLCRLRMQALRAREAYKQIARQVYLNKRDYFLSFDQHAYKPNIDGTALEANIKAIIQHELRNPNELLLDKREDSGDVFVVSTHIQIGSNKAALMRSYQTKRVTNPDLDTNMPIWQAMKATSVAPRYMPPQGDLNHRMIIEPGLVDHGTAKNNPVRDILYECRKLYRFAGDMLIIISIGTGLGYGRENEIADMARSMSDRNAEAEACGARFEADYRYLIEMQVMKYFRFNVPLEDIPLEEWCQEDLIMKKTSEYLARPDIGYRFYGCVDAIAQLLQTP